MTTHDRTVDLCEIAILLLESCSHGDFRSIRDTAGRLLRLGAASGRPPVTMLAGSGISSY